MISVDQALEEIFKHCHPLGIKRFRIDDSHLLGCVLAEDIISDQSIPLAPTSMMDGYAVSAPLPSGVYKIDRAIYAGDESKQEVENEEVASSNSLSTPRVVYITTGSQLPPGTNGVVKIEDTTEDTPGEVNIRVSVGVGQFVRPIGCDIAIGQPVLLRGQTIGSIEIGLLATLGIVEVSVYRKAVLGVLSTGNELVNPWENCPSHKIRDSNRITLLTTFRQAGYEVIDLGIASDEMEGIREQFLQGERQCDVIVSTGGVSKGQKDFVLPLLRQLGTVHFNQLNLKPGKPTTFASWESEDLQKKGWFFGLPGNPVSCLVTSSLFVFPALRLIQGYPKDQAFPPMINCYLLDEEIPLDAERAEYHRVQVTWDGAKWTARSTGSQRSSRLLSMQDANGLLALPSGPGKVVKGTWVQTWLTGSLPHGPPPTATAQNLSVKASPNASCGYSCSTSKIDPTLEWTAIRVGLLTISDRASQGVYDDKSGPMMAQILQEMSQKEGYPLTFDIIHQIVVPDDVRSIQTTIDLWTLPGVDKPVDLILTSGGTGFGERDNTPEAIKVLLHREAPGIAQAMLNEGLRYTPLALLSRPVAGTRHKTFIATLPGSVKAVKENIYALQPLLPRILELLKTNDCNPRFNK